VIILLSLTLPCFHFILTYPAVLLFSVSLTRFHFIFGQLTEISATLISLSPNSFIFFPK